LVCLSISVYLLEDHNKKNNKFIDFRPNFTNSLKLPKNGSVYLIIGPFKDKDDNLIENAKVTLFVLNRTLINYTNDVGIVQFEFDFIVPNDLYQVKAEAEGYDSNIFRIELEIYN
jgi:hypothetical protein